MGSHVDLDSPRVLKVGSFFQNTSSFIFESGPYRRTRVPRFVVDRLAQSDNTTRALAARAWVWPATSSTLKQNMYSPAEVNTYTTNDLLDSLIRSAGEVEAILYSACKAWFYAPKLEGCRLRFFHLRKVHLQKVLQGPNKWYELTVGPIADDTRSCERGFTQPTVLYRMNTRSSSLDAG